MASTRPRKTAAAKPTDGKDTPDTNADAQDEQQSPDAAPLEAPAPAEEPAPEPSPYSSPVEAIPDDDNLSEVILDDETKKAPKDIDAVFEPVTEHGTALRCTMRLVERTFLGPHASPVERLLLPLGAEVSPQVADRIRSQLEEQAKRERKGKK